MLHRVRAKLEVMAELGATTVLACSNVARRLRRRPRPDRRAAARASATLAAEHGVTVAFEALAWGRHVNRVGQAWEAVVRADHPAVTLAVDTFHMLARGDDGAALAGIPGDRIGFLQVADAPLLDMDVLEWSRHHRCFPGQGTLDVPGWSRPRSTAGYRGPLSLEVFSDVVREADPDVTARDAMRSLVFLEDQLVRRLPARERSPGRTPLRRPPAGPTPRSSRSPDPDGSVAALVGRLGFARAGTHRSQAGRPGGATATPTWCSTAPPPRRPRRPRSGSSPPRSTAVAARARALLWPAVDRTRGDGEALLPGVTCRRGCTCSSATSPGEADDWRATS